MTTSASETLGKAALSTVSFASAMSLANNLVSYEISQVSLETGATEYEQRLETVHSIVQSVGGAGVALVSGAIEGGPVGFAAALVDVAVSGINKAINIWQRGKTLAAQQALEDVSINMALARAGTGGRRGSNQ